MATVTKRIELEHIVWTWERRDQIRRFALWLPRALASGLIGFGGAWLILRLINTPLTVALAIAVLIGIVVAAGVIAYRLRARPLMGAVRHFDQALGLQERTSTALELLSGRIQTVDEIAAYQLDDAYRTAQQVDIRQAVPLVVKWREWLLLIPLLAICALLVFATQPPPVDALNPATREAIETAADDVRDITESVANDTSLDAAERETLLETLETSLDALETEPLSAEEAFASLSQVEDALKNQANNLRSTTQNENATYEAAAQTLNSQNSSDSSDSGISEFQKAIQKAQEDLASGSSTEAMEQSMQQASEMMQNSSSEMAEHLADAAQSMREGDTQGAQDALNQAAQSAQQAQESQNQREATAQSLDNAAENTSKAADNVAQSEQQQTTSQDGQQSQQSESQNQGDQQSSQGQQSQQGNQQQGDQPPQQGQQAQEGQQGDQGQQSQPGDSAQQGQPGESDQGNSDQGSPSEGQSSESSSGESPSSDNPGDQGAPDGQNPDSPSGSGGGAGDQEGQTQETSSSGGQFSQDNNPDGQGESEYEPVYAPQRITADGTSDVILDPEASNQTLEEGEFQSNPDGESRVPYNQVFREYSEAASQAIEGGYIPLSLRDVVQDYFTSIAPEEK
jgi:hypothetical protein